MIELTPLERDALTWGLSDFHDAMTALKEAALLIKETAQFTRDSVIPKQKPLELSLELDGNQWSVLAGSNIQEGVCGFGDTPEEAITEFAKEWLKTRSD